MGKKADINPIISVSYDNHADILTFSFTSVPVPAIAEEAADEIWIRYDPETHKVITADVLNFSHRIRKVFGPGLTYTERTDTDVLESLNGLLLQSKD